MNHLPRIINTDEKYKMFFQGSWIIERTVCYEEVQICETADIRPEEGYALTFLINGIVKPLKPGKYLGQIRFEITKPYYTEPSGLMYPNQVSAAITPAVMIDQGKVIKEQSVLSAVISGDVKDDESENLCIESSAESFNGIYIKDSEYRISNAIFDLFGNGANDYVGAGSGVAAVGESKVEVEDCRMNFAGVTRCAVHVGGNSNVVVRNCEIVNFSPESNWLGSFSWQLPLKGTNRLCQLCDNGEVLYDRCLLKTNGWGILSIDGVDEHAKITVRDSKMELSGPSSHGYGVFCIGPSEVTVDNTEVDVYGYPLLLMGMAGEAKLNVLRSSLIKGRRFGAMIMHDDDSKVTIEDSSFITGSSSIVIKSSITSIDIAHSTFTPGNGVLIQMMDDEQSQMNQISYNIPVGIKDKRIENRDLCHGLKNRDVVISFSDSSLEGDIYNSTTNIRAYRNSELGGMGTFHDTLIGPVSFTSPAGEMEDVPEGVRLPRTTDELCGPINLQLEFHRTSISGTISAAEQFYREGLTKITNDNWFELGNITQKAAPVVNNGVIVILDAESSWTVTGKSYLSAMEIAEGALVNAESGKTVQMKVNGLIQDIVPGRYEGDIEISIK